MIALLGIDAGTSTCKAVLVERDGAVVAASLVPYPSGPAPSNPEEWWETVAAAVHALRADLRRVNVVAVGVCARGSGVVFVTGEGRPAEVVSGDGPWRGSAARAPKMYDKIARWGQIYRTLAQASRATAESVVAVLSVKDFIAFRLTGVMGADPSNASCPAWPRTPELYGIPRGILPPMRPVHAVLGVVTPQAARVLDLPAGVPVAVGGHDGVCANIGAGVLRLGEGCLTLGTNGVVRINTARPLFGTREFAPFTYPFVYGLWASGADAIGAGAAMTWLARMLGYDTSNAARFVHAHETLDALAARVAPGADGVVYFSFPHRNGSPCIEINHEGAFVGLRQTHGTGHLARAVMEGGALALRGILERFMRLASCRGPLRLTGGGTRSRIWPQIVASAIGRPLGLVEPEPSARGAAILAAVAARLWPDLRIAVGRMVRETGKVYPIASEQMIYARAAHSFERLVRQAVLDAQRLAAPETKKQQ